jgi:hypothetical protein
MTWREHLGGQRHRALSHVRSLAMPKGELSQPNKGRKRYVG